MKKSTSYKIIIPAEVERTIRFLCERVWDTEWSGVLFYTPSGNFEDGSLEIHCVDIFPMDIGNATYTEFNMSPDVISYMAEKPELLDCKMGLIHSHNNMSTFFSGTDLSTLKEEGNERNHFVSLIVNNAGNYTAAITRKIKYVSVRDFSYEGFDSVVHSDTKETINGEEIEYFNLDIVFEESSDNRFKEISDRLSDIKKTKAETSKTTKYPMWTAPSPSTTYNTAVKEPTLFSNVDWKSNQNYYSSPVKSSESTIKTVKLSTKDIDKIVNQLLTGSVTLTKLDDSTKEKVIKTIDSRFDARFGKGDKGMELFEYWAQDFIEFLLWFSLDDQDMNDSEIASEIAERVIKALETLSPSKYIDRYIELLVCYVERS